MFCKTYTIIIALLITVKKENYLVLTYYFVDKLNYLQFNTSALRFCYS